MPASNEIVQNRPLTGIEARKIIVADVESILGRDGLFTEYVAFGRLCYRIKVELMLDNPAYPKHETVIRSRAQAKGSLTPQIEPGPLVEPSAEAVTIGIERERMIDNPNAERIKRGMPLTVNQRDPNTGHFAEKELMYGTDLLPPDDLDTNKGMTDKDITKQITDEGWEL